MTKYIDIFVMQVDLGLEKKKDLCRGGGVGGGGGGKALIVVNAVGFNPAHQRFFFLN